MTKTDALTLTSNDGALPAAKRFCPPNATDTPRDLFYHSLANLKADVLGDKPAVYGRLRRRTAPYNEILIYTDGSCLDQGSHRDTSARRAGCSWVFATDSTDHDGPVGSSCRLEQRGPTGQTHSQTSNCAQLRALIGALEYPIVLEGEGWKNKGWKRVVIATDSSSVVNGITEWVTTWQGRGWKNSAGKPVANHDLWERLLALVNRKENVVVSFWSIPRALNTLADASAKDAAESMEAVEDSFGGFADGTRP